MLHAAPFDYLLTYAEGRSHNREGIEQLLVPAVRQAVLMQPAAEMALREQIMHRLATGTAESGGFLARAELSDFEYASGQRRRLIDTSKGIWNPRDLSATLSIVSSPDGPYDDRDVDGGLFRYDYRAGSTEGDNGF